MSNAPLHRTFLSGFVWTSGTKWVTQIVSWASVFYTARLLSPTDFGIAGMVGFLGIVAQVLAELGLGSAVLQMKSLKEREIGQLHVVSMFLGVVSMGFCYLAAPWLAVFFHQPEVEALAVWNSIGFLAMAIQAIPQGLLQRDLDYRRLSLMEGWQAILQAVVLVGCALAGLRYWSFVISVILGRVLAAGLAWYWRPVPLCWPRWSEVKGPLQFGLDVSGARLSGSLALQADGVVIGRMMGDEALGVYRLAVNLASAPIERVAQLVTRVTGPLFARLNHDSAEMGRYFFVLNDAMLIVLGPLTVGLMVTMPEMVSVLLGSKWRATVEPALWLAIYMSLRSVVALAQQVLVSLGRTRYFLWTSVLNLAVLPPSFWLASHYELWTVAAVWLWTSPLLLLPQIVTALRGLKRGIWEYVQLLLPALGCSVAMGITVWMFRRGLPASWPEWVRLGAMIALGAGVYCGLLWVTIGGRLNRYYHIIRRK